jgi:Pyruvate/2-oxoacid:ferredoxin oxidoreductase gamma subunit
MVADQCPRIAIRLELAEQIAETIQKTFPVGIVQKNLLTVDPAGNHMMQRARRIDSRFTWHDP